MGESGVLLFWTLFNFVFVRMGDRRSLIVLVLELVRERKFVYVFSLSLLRDVGLSGYLESWEGLLFVDLGVVCRVVFFLVARLRFLVYLLLLFMEIVRRRGVFSFLFLLGLMIY